MPPGHFCSYELCSKKEVQQHLGARVHTMLWLHVVASGWPSNSAVNADVRLVHKAYCQGTSNIAMIKKNAKV